MYKRIKIHKNEKLNKEKDNTVAAAK